MLRTLFATTATVALLTAGAFAQDADTKMPADSTMEAPADANGAMSTEQGQNPSIFAPGEDYKPVQSSEGFYSAYEGQILASSILGKTVYGSESADAEAIGDINDVILAPDGRAEAVIVGVGGFLGMGEKEVAIDFSRVSWFDIDGEQRLSLSATREELEAAPEFDRATITGDDTMMDNNMDNGMAPADGAMAPADGMAPADDAMAPADGANADAAMDPTTKSGDDAMAPEGTEAQPMDGAAKDGDTQTLSSNMDNMSVVALDSVSADQLIGARVYGGDDADLGEIDDVILTDDGKVEAYIVDVGGFLGVGEKPVALSAAELEIMQDENASMVVKTSFTKEQLEAQPTYTAEEYKNNPDAMMMR